MRQAARPPARPAPPPAAGMSGMSGMSGQAGGAAAYSPSLDFSDARNGQYLALSPF